MYFIEWCFKTETVTQTEKVKSVKHSTRGSKTIIQTASRLIVFLSFPVSFFFFGVRCELLVSFVEQLHCYKLNRPYWHTIQWFAWDKKKWMINEIVKDDIFFDKRHILTNLVQNQKTREYLITVPTQIGLAVK